MNCPKLKVCVAMQPTYLPWMGLFGLMLECSDFVYLDHCQVVKRYWDVRNRIKTASGELYLTVPVIDDKRRSETTFHNARIDETSGWRKKHLKSIFHSYRPSKHFEVVYPLLEKLLGTEYSSLGELNKAIITSLAEQMKLLPPTLHHSSQMGTILETKDAMLVSICKKLNCSKYLSPIGAKEYIDREKPNGDFTDAKISLRYQNFVHPEYPQLHGPFISHLSVIDVLFNCGLETTADLIRKGQHSVDCSTV